MDPKSPSPPRKISLLKKLLLILLLPLLGLAGWGIHSAIQKRKLQKRPPGLEARAFKPLPLGSIRPKGWLEGQMRLQAKGQTGHLDEFWPDVADSGWIGGKAEGWERVPYWLDGLVPLAYQLDDPVLKKKAFRYIDHILKHQKPDGWLGPETSPPASGLVNAQPPQTRDPWPQFVILKVLSQYAEATGDARVLPAMRENLRILSLQLDSRKLFAWNYFRWCDLLPSVAWVHERDPNPAFLALAYKAASQGYNWPAHFRDLPAKERLPQWDWQGHVVNNAMGLKAPAFLHHLTGDPKFRMSGVKALEQLDRYHGQANGLFSGDECLAGRSPSQGTELCAVVEMMYSLEETLSLLGDPRDGDRLEKVAFNALAGAFSADHWHHQYVQQANQAACVWTDQPVFASVGPEASLFGLEPHYGCCTANRHQGWPKFTSHLWMASPDGGLAAVAYAPSVVKAVLPRGPVEVELATEYPFRDKLTFTVRVPAPMEFPLHLRVPGWAKGAVLSLPGGEQRRLRAGEFHKVLRTWSQGEVATLETPMEFRVRRGFNDSVSLERGPLVLSLGVREDWRQARPFKFQTKDKKRYDYQVLPTGPWNYALELEVGDPAKSLSIEEAPLGEDPFTLKGAPLSARVKGRRLESWGFDRGAAHPPPKSPVESVASLEELTLVPYGSARIRITEFPLLK
jgi:hypothetical protein